MSAPRTHNGGAARAIVRAPNHLGDLVMALPALHAAGGADVMLVRGLLPIAQMAGLTGEIIPLDRNRSGFWSAARELRARRYDRGVLLPPSLSSALLFAAGGVRHRRGAATQHREALLHDRVPRDTLGRLHRSAAYHLLVTGGVPSAPPVPVLAVPDEDRERFRVAAGLGPGTTVGLFPGSNASSRRWDADRYASLARRLTRGGARVLVFGGEAERRLTAQVAGEAAVDLGGRTDLPMFAAGLAACSVLVTNDSGPMHLAAAIGTPTVSLWGAGDPAVTRPLGDDHLMLRHPELPCVPCVKNVCPRTGDKGYVLPDGTRECLRLISVDDALTAVRAHRATALTSS